MSAGAAALAAPPEAAAGTLAAREMAAAPKQEAAMAVIMVDLILREALPLILSWPFPVMSPLVFS
jgi:hypothetical protein